jgi:hypothetical protein
MKLLKRANLEAMARKTNINFPAWDDEERLNIDPEEEIKYAFTKMTDEQLEFHAQIGGKNKQYADVLLNFRKKDNK